MTEADNHKVFTLSASRLVRPWTRRKLLAAMPVALIIIIAGAWAALYDFRYVFPALIALFVLWAGMTTWAWLAIIGDREVAQLTRPQRWSYAGGICTVELYRFPEPMADKEQNPEPPVIYRTFSFRPEHVTSIERISGDLALYLDRNIHPALRYLVISQQAMPAALEQDIYNLSS